MHVERASIEDLCESAQEDAAYNYIALI